MDHRFQGWPYAYLIRVILIIYWHRPPLNGCVERETQQLPSYPLWITCRIRWFSSWRHVPVVLRVGSSKMQISFGCHVCTVHTMTFCKARKKKVRPSDGNNNIGSSSVLLKKKKSVRCLRLNIAIGRELSADAGVITILSFLLSWVIVATK